MSRPGLLHNMSAPPTAVIRHQAAAPAARALLFRLPPSIRNAAPRGLLAALTGRRWNGSAGEAADAELRRRINEHAARLPLPPAALVAASAEQAEEVESLLTICTVLSKSSEHVYLRDKEPNLTHIERGRRIVLQLPGTLEKES